MASNEGSNSSRSDKKKSSSTNPVATQPIQPTPFGSMPKLPDKVDWVRSTIEVKAYFKRFVGYVKVLLEPPPDDPDGRAAHITIMNSLEFLFFFNTPPAPQ